MMRLFIASLPAWVVLGAALLFLTSPALACTEVVASHYGKESGSRTSSGSFFDGSQMVAAHRTLPFGTKIRVTYRGQSVNLTVKDRGPFIRGRDLDISTAAAIRIGLDKPGVATVCMEKL